VQRPPDTARHPPEVKELTQEEIIELAEKEKNKQVGVVIKLFWDTNKAVKYGNPTERQAAEDLLDNYGMEEITKMVEYVKTIKGDKYAPLVTTPWEMWTKYAKLKDYQLKNSVQAPSPVIKPKGYAELRSAAYIFKRDWYKHKNYDGDDGQTYFRFKGENREEWWKMCPSEQQSVAEIFVGIESTPKTSLAQLNEVLSVLTNMPRLIN